MIYCEPLLQRFEIMSGNYSELAVPSPALSCDERSPAFVNPCQSSPNSHNITAERCENAASNHSGVSETGFVQSSGNGTSNTEELGSGFTAHFVSNGYYGFQPLSLALVTEVDCQMDMDELNAVEGEEGSSCHEIVANGTSFEPYRWQKPHTGIDSKYKSFTVLGKRNWDGVTELHTDIKRIRQEEPSSLTVCFFQGVDCGKMSADFSESLFSERSADFHYPRCNISQYV